MKVLVTGGAGFVGTNLIKRLVDDNHEVISVDNYSTGKRENHHSSCKYYDIDLSKDRFWELSNTCYCEFTCDCRIEEPDIIFHIAALARIQPSFENPLATFKSNIIGTQNVLEYARKLNVPVIFAGSSSVTGDVYANPYTFTKWQGEDMVKMYGRVFDVPTAICRFYNVYGPHQLTEGAYCNVLGIFERQYKNNEPLTITWDGEQRRDFTHVEDIVDGLIRVSNAMNGEVDMRYAGEVFELGNSNNRSINELADAFGDYPREYIEKRPGEMRETLNTDTKALDVLGWKPKNDIINYIEVTYEIQK